MNEFYNEIIPTEQEISKLKEKYKWITYPIYNAVSQVQKMPFFDVDGSLL